MCWFVWIYSKDNMDLSSSFLKIQNRWNETTFIDNWNYKAYYTRLVTDWILFKEKDYLNSILYNGIIYNTAYLKDKFNLDSLDFDSLILKEWYQKYWINFLENIRWMFAFVYYNKKTIDLVRDSIGVKPLYYIYWKNIFAFSSEIKAITDLSKKYNIKIVELLPWEIIKFDIKLVGK